MSRSCSCNHISQIARLLLMSLSKPCRNVRLFPSLTIGFTGLQLCCFNHMHHQTSYSRGLLWASWKRRSQKLAATTKTGCFWREIPPRDVQHPSEHTGGLDGWGKKTELSTLICFFTFLLLSFNVLLGCCFDFLNPGSAAKSNPNIRVVP